MWIDSPAPEGLIVIESRGENDHEFVVKEIRKLETVIYRYWKESARSMRRAWKNTHGMIHTSKGTGLANCDSATSASRCR